MVNKDYQNSLVGIVLSSDIRSNAKQNLADLHWLHVRARIHYKIALLTFKSITTHRPTYLIRPTSIPNDITSSPLQRPLSASQCWSQNCFRQWRVLPRRSDNLGGTLYTSWSHW